MNKQLIENLGFDKFFLEQGLTEDLDWEIYDIARVTEVHREKYKIIGAAGEKLAHLKTSIFHIEISAERFPAVGDFVVVRKNQDGEDTILRVFEDRKSVV